VIAGNHDISLDGEYWRTHLDEDDEPEEHDEALAIMTGLLAKASNIIYLTEGTHTFTLNNGTTFSIFASPYQPECGDWAFGYPRTQDHFGEAKIPANVDIVMTHGPPAGCLDLIPGKQENAGCDSLLRAMQIARPKLHCFGHMHEGYGHMVQRWQPCSPESMEKPSEVTITKAGVDVAEETRRELHAGRDTLMVNAAIMDDSNQPSNAPWVVELELA
jgi:hypothetical protein